jgi:RNA polymerase sigma-70 factor (ECF subfamily)
MLGLLATKELTVSGDAERLAGPSHKEPSEPAARQPLSFDALYERHFDFVWRSVRFLGVTPDAVDDAVQDVFLVAHRRLSDFEARASERTWLFAISLRVVRDYRRSRGRRKRLIEQAKTMQLPPATTPHDSAVRSEMSALVFAALERLPEEQRAVFVLSELEEASAPEIADILRVNVNTVYSRLRAARREVARQLREQGRAIDDEP